MENTPNLLIFIQLPRRPSIHIRSSNYPMRLSEKEIKDHFAAFDVHDIKIALGRIGVLDEITEERSTSH